GRVVGEGANASEAAADPTAHAEMIALRRAAARGGDWRLSGATLYVTLEPCPMCLGAALQAHVGRVVFGADNVREGALGGAIDLRGGDWKRRIDVRGGVLAREAGALLSRFFAARRSG
ncbi:MAG TPA: nucleoside deaminase, partial [Trueperaceae bacterium]|nr:nucleoside deaminase [Trueperaceae bacterium]